ncbi:mechanosensitive ion channel family protein [Halocalculus aciditolerans]|uniref:Mechanosensitive ion channel protein MscS n=1 Tax=Halocalculus aciditolerans TaxID=1383812 RepID=A0A830F9I1_9EURY|nr:mechanosensitive ion channel family protein [Halocalculus aciditolerans]GGL53005.1 mechanosensitive ion channel protein MscS [Halocalculus aciditolerans]
MVSWPPGTDPAVLLEEYRLVVAVLCLLAGWYGGRLVVRVAGRRVARRFQRPSVTRTILRLVKAGGVAVGVLSAFHFAGIGLGNVVLSVTVFSAVLGVVLAPLVGSVINGVFVLWDQPYEIGDMIELTDRGQTGFVEDITLSYTKIFTLDNTFIVIPNASMRERDVVNYSAEDERTRLSLTLEVTYEGDLEHARALMEGAAASVDGVLAGGPDIRIGSARYPAGPRAHIDTFADSAVRLRLRYWVREPYQLSRVKSNVQEAIWERFESASDVEIAYPHMHHVFDETSGEAAVSLRER